MIAIDSADLTAMIFNRTGRDINKWIAFQCAFWKANELSLEKMANIKD